MSNLINEPYFDQIYTNNHLDATTLIVLVLISLSWVFRVYPKNNNPKLLSTPIHDVSLCKNSYV